MIAESDFVIIKAKLKELNIPYTVHRYGRGKLKPFYVTLTGTKVHGGIESMVFSRYGVLLTNASLFSMCLWVSKGDRDLYED